MTLALGIVMGVMMAAMMFGMHRKHGGKHGGQEKPIASSSTTAPGGDPAVTGHAH